jgi:hypothetical protein
MTDQSEADRVVAAFRKAIAQFADPTITIHEVWADTPQSACVIYECSPSVDGLLGRRITFPPHAVTDDPESTGADWAQNVIEPLGSLAFSLQKDALGISWIGIRDGKFPVPPGRNQNQ